MLALAAAGAGEGAKGETFDSKSDEFDANWRKFDANWRKFDNVREAFSQRFNGVKSRRLNEMTPVRVLGLFRNF